MLNKEDLISALVSFVEFRMNNNSKNIAENLLKLSNNENVSLEKLETYFEIIKLSTMYSVRETLEILHELNLINLNQFQSSHSESSLHDMIEFLKHHRVIENPKNDE